MAKYFRDISIHLGMGENLPNGMHEREFNITTHTVQDLFYYNIPPKFNLKNISKLNLEIYNNATGQSGLQWPEGIVMYNFIGFNFEKYFKLTKLEQNLLILKVLELTITDLLIGEPEKLELMVQIMNSIKKSGFDQKFASPRLSVWNKSRSHRGTVIYRVNDNGQNAYFMVEDKEGNILIEEFLLKNQVYEFSENLKSVSWIDNSFQIYTKQGKVFRELRLEKNRS